MQSGAGFSIVSLSFKINAQALGDFLWIHTCFLGLFQNILNFLLFGFPDFPLGLGGKDRCLFSFQHFHAFSRGSNFSIVAGYGSLLFRFKISNCVIYGFDFSVEIRSTLFRRRCSLSAWHSSASGSSRQPITQRKVRASVNCSVHSLSAPRPALALSKAAHINLSPSPSPDRGILFLSSMHHLFP